MRTVPDKVSAGRCWGLCHRVLEGKAFRGRVASAVPNRSGKGRRWQLRGESGHWPFTMWPRTSTRKLAASRKVSVVWASGLSAEDTGWLFTRLLWQFPGTPFRP